MGDLETDLDLDEMHPSEVVLIDLLAQSPLLSVYRSGCDMVCRYANEAYRAHFPTLAAVGISLEATFPDHDMSAVIAKYHHVMNSGEVQRQPEVEVEVDGERRWFDVFYRRHAYRGTVLGIVGQAIEVTDRVQQRHRQDRRLAQLEAIVAQAPVAMGILDGQGRLRSINEAGADILGRPALALQGGELFELFPELGELRAPMRSVLSTGQAFRGVVDLEPLFGTSRRFDMTFTRIDGLVEHELLVVANEVTELADARDRAESALASRDAFFAVVSHELRAPVHAIHGWAQLLDRVPGEAMRAQAASVIQRNAQDLDHLVGDLLDAARFHRGQLALVSREADLAAVVAEVVESARPVAGERKVELHLGGVDTLAPLRCDPSRVRQVLWNLLHNALRLSSAGSTVAVAVTRADGGYAVDVTDEGPGIEADQLDAIFAWGASGHGSGSLGIGLALSRQIAELHGGGLGVRSAGVGKGATFTLSLPA